MSALTPRERRLLAALERLVRGARVAEAVMRSGNCPKCGAEPVDNDGVFDEVFALSMCSTEDWLDIHDAIAEADSEIAGAHLDAVRPGRERLRDVVDSMVALDLAHSKGLHR